MNMRAVLWHHKWWLVVFVIVSIALVSVDKEMKEKLQKALPEAVAFTSTHNRKPSGYSALYEVLEKSGIEALTWQLPYRDLLEKRRHGTLVIVGPDIMPADHDVDAILKWVKQGNDLVVLDPFDDFSGSGRLCNELDVKVVDAPDLVNKLMPLDGALPEAKFARNLSISSYRRIKGGVPLLSDSKGAVLSEVSYNGGTCLLGTVPSLCSNRRISKEPQNFQFMVSYLASAKQPIMFDERAHGFSSGTNVLVFLARGPVGYTLLQMGILLAVAIWSLNRRFGAPLSVPPVKRVSTLEFIDGLSSTYMRAKARGAAWHMIYSSLKTRVRKALSVTPEEGDNKLIQTWAESTGTDPDRYAHFLGRADQAADNAHLSDADLVGLVNDADRLIGETPKLAARVRGRGA